jgi:hypothetical protein
MRTPAPRFGIFAWAATPQLELQKLPFRFQATPIACRSNQVFRHALT